MKGGAVVPFPKKSTGSRLPAFYLRFIGAAAVAGGSLWATTLDASATCFCVVSDRNLEGQTKADSFNVDLTSQVATSYVGVFQQSEDAQRDCARRCRAQVVTFSSQSSNAGPFCAAGVPDNSSLSGYSKVGTKIYWHAWDENKNPTTFYFSLKNIPQQIITYYTCPPGWYTFLTNALGGQSSDSRCKKLAGHLTLNPLPANGTLVGDWGATWVDEIWAWGTQANGGAATKQTYYGAAAQCGFY